jgi:hypothetical protein
LPRAFYYGNFRSQKSHALVPLTGLCSSGSAAAAQGEAEAHRGHHEGEDDRRGEASQVHRREKAARTLLRKRTHRAYSFRERTV